jgi:hypothetical protein
VFLSVTRGFDVPAGTVILISSASFAASVGTADYAAEFVRVAAMLRNTFGGGVSVMHGIPFLLGGTKNSPAIRALAEIGQWIHLTSVGTEDISATRKAFAASLRTDISSAPLQYIIRLPHSQLSGEKVPFVVTGFDNLKTAIEPLSEEDEKVLISLLIEELNSLYPVNLDIDIICDRFTGDNVFDDKATDRKDLVLIGASHLANIGKHLNPELWKITDLTTPGWRINDNSVASLITALTETAGAVDWATATVILQLYDNSVYMVSGPRGEKFLPRKDKKGTYHIEGSLAVADKAAVKDLLARLSPLLKELGECRKIVLTPLARYWVSPCCEDVTHHINYSTPGYLPRLGDAVHALRDNIRDSLYTKKLQNFRVLCPNRMVGVGQRLQEPTDEEAAKAAALWGRDPVHPTGAAY